MRPLLKVLATFAMVVLACSGTYAAGITGTVKGPDGAAFRGAFVQAVNTKTKVTVSVLSDKNGHYQVEDLPAGDYELRIKVAGFRAAPKTGVSLAAQQNATFDFALQAGMVRWNDLSVYQGSKLLPEGKGKDILFGPCFRCHGFQTRMAGTGRDLDGWKDRVSYMREVEHYFLSRQITDEKADDVASYMNSVFGQDSTLPKSPAELPGYKDLVHNFSDEAMNIVWVEYDLPGPSRMPWSGAPDKDGYVWIPYYGPANRIGRLDPKTGEVKEFRVPMQATAGIHSAVAAPDGTVWIAEQGGNRVGRWDPKTQEITEYKDAYLPGKEETTQGGSKHTIRFDALGNVWSTGDPLSKLDPKTGKFTDLWDEVPYTYGAAVDKGGNIWFTNPGGQYIGTVDARTMKVSKWTPPSKGGPRRIQVDTDGTVWFDEFTSGKIGQFDPETQKFKEYDLPGPSPSINAYALGIDKNHDVWYSSEQLDIVGRLDPKTGKVVEYPFPHSENAMREFFYDSQGRMWWASPSNNKVGYFYLAGTKSK
jgi:virginiamycin B lyase